jgi:hypothetical protein
MYQIVCASGSAAQSSGTIRVSWVAARADNRQWSLLTKLT